jgi:aspartate/methionine/tyrosine aminotransferase
VILADEVYDKVLYDGAKHTRHRQPVEGTCSR